MDFTFKYYKEHMEPFYFYKTSNIQTPSIKFNLTGVNSYVVPKI